MASQAEILTATNLKVCHIFFYNFTILLYFHDLIILVSTLMYDLDSDTEMVKM